jgi:hypothetical protein
MAAMTSRLRRPELRFGALPFDYIMLPRRVVLDPVEALESCMLGKILPVAVLSLASLAACASSTAPTTRETDATGTAEALSTPHANRIMDGCTVSAIGAAAADAFGDNNLQHLVGLTVDGAPGAEDGTITYTVTTENDEDGATDRKVVVTEKGDKCDVKSIDPLDGKMPSAKDAKDAYTAVVDDCTFVALESAAKLAFATGNDLQHLHGLSLDGDPAVEGVLSYTITIGNAEDGDTDFAAKVKQTINLSTGKSTCVVQSVKEKK